jgi:SAM-dependent methyltransferase
MRYKEQVFLDVNDRRQKEFRMDAIAQFKQTQKAAWTTFAPLEAVTMTAAPRLVRWAGVKAGQRVLDVACGTGVVAVTCARLGARVTGCDLTPELLERARENSAIAGVDIEWKEADVEALPFPDATFDVVVSQFGHMFAPRPQVAVGEMLRVLKSGGTIAFSTWPPELQMGRMFALHKKYGPPPPEGVSPPPMWGDPAVVRDRLGAAVQDLLFDRASMRMPALSPQHQRVTMERSAGPVRKLVEALAKDDPARLAQFRRDFEAIVAEYFHNNFIRQDFLMTRAVKV